MEILPLSSLDALLSWNGPGNLKNFLKGLPPLHPRSPPTSLLDQCSGKNFKTLVCHDMCNGYKDDKYVSLNYITFSHTIYFTCKLKFIL